MTKETEIENTPFISIDLNTVRQNIKDMQEIANRNGLSLKPHAKTHKSIDIAKMQIAAGAVGITVAKPEEAMAFMKEGIQSIKICYPVISEEKALNLIQSAKKYGVALFFSIDSEHGLNTVENASKALSSISKIYIEIDVGLKRCGFNPDDKNILNIAERIKKSDHLELHGLSAHAGQSYAVKNIKDSQEISNHENKILKKLKVILDIKNICIGSTPTLWVQNNFEDITEIKPGNYVFNDLTQKNIGVVEWNRLALSIVTSIISINETYMIIDAGSKALTSDAGAHGINNVKGFGLCFTMNEKPHDNGLIVEKLSEEHGFIKHDGRPLPIGTKIRIYPNHSCPVVNLFNELHIFEDGKLKEIWPVTARGCVH